MASYKIITLLICIPLMVFFLIVFIKLCIELHHDIKYGIDKIDTNEFDTWLEEHK